MIKNSASALAIAASGLSAASTRTAVRAQNVANVLTPGYAPLGVEQTATSAGVRAEARPLAPASAVAVGGVDLVTELVDLQAAKRAFQASAAALRTADEQSKELIDLLG
ncbi:MAG: flagellar basal body rod C-terminal domain-containing protein [Pseudomonadota bacterium]